MANIKCFKALRPKQEFVSQVAALPYDVVNEKKRGKKSRIISILFYMWTNQK